MTDVIHQTITTKDMKITGRPVTQILRGYWAWHCISHETGEEVSFSAPEEWSMEALVNEARSQLHD